MSYFYVFCSKNILTKPVGCQQRTCLCVKMEFVVGTNGVAAIWTFWIYPVAAESEEAAKKWPERVQCRKYLQEYCKLKVFRVLYLFPEFKFFSSLFC